jgi:sugar lactone lactonase YvrE
MFSYFLAQLQFASSACWSTNSSTIVGSINSAPGWIITHLSGNAGIRITDNDTLYITDLNNNRIVIIDLNNLNTSMTILVGNGTSVSQMNAPTDVFVTQTSIYVLDGGNFRVIKWSKNRSNPVIVAGINDTKGNLSSYTTIGSSHFIFVDKNDNLYVSDTKNHRILRFYSNSSTGATGVMVAGTGIAGSNATQLNAPNGIFVDDNGTLYIADLYNNRIQRWESGASYGERVAGDGINGSSATSIFYPTSVFVDTNGSMYITELKNSRVTRWAANSSVGACIAACSGTKGNASNQLMSPQALAFDSSGSLYVSDETNNRIQKFEFIGECSKRI